MALQFSLKALLLHISVELAKSYIRCNGKSTKSIITVTHGMGSVGEDCVRIANDVPLKHIHTQNVTIIFHTMQHSHVVI